MDVSQFKGLIILGVPTDHEVAEALKKIEKHFSHFASGSTRFKVETITAEKAQEKKTKQLAEMKKAAESEEERS